MFAGLLVSCKSDKNAAKISVQEQVEIAEDFLKFYEDFHTDTVFQMNHIMFPLAGQPNEVGDGFTLEGPFTWEKEYWVLHRPFDDMGGTFERGFDEFSGIITEIIKSRDGQFSMIRRFSKINNEWMLIYYKEMGL